MIGSLLRLPHEVVKARMLESLGGDGFDITPTELGVFLYPGPDRRRPIDLARQCNMTRQAMNYVLRGLELPRLYRATGQRRHDDHAHPHDGKGSGHGQQDAKVHG